MKIFAEARHERIFVSKNEPKNNMWFGSIGDIFFGGSKIKENEIESFEGDSWLDFEKWCDEVGNCYIEFIDLDYEITESYDRWREEEIDIDGT